MWRSCALERGSTGLGRARSGRPRPATANAGNLAPLQAAGGGMYIASKATATLCNDTVESNSARSGDVVAAGLTDGGGI